jgi:hypothetical protein
MAILQQWLVVRFTIALIPIATFLMEVPHMHRIAPNPRLVLVLPSEHPNTTPQVVGVARDPPPPAAAHLRPPVQAESAVRTCALVPTDKAVNVPEPVPTRTCPFAVKSVGSRTQAVSREIVPEVVIVPPESPVPAVMLVTVPDPPLTVPQQMAFEPLLIKT